MFSVEAGLAVAGWEGMGALGLADVEGGEGGVQTLSGSDEKWGGVFGCV